MRPFERSPDGSVAASLTALETQLLGDLAAQVIELLGEDRADGLGIGGGDAPSTDPAIARLLPNAYNDDDAAAQEFRRFTESSLTERKIANARAVILSLDGGSEIALGADEQQAWLRAINDIRLIIASRLGIERDEDRGREESDDDLAMRDIYDWLATVQGSLIDALE
jgi:hypothetical protein